MCFRSGPSDKFSFLSESNCREIVPIVYIYYPKLQFFLQTQLSILHQRNFNSYNCSRCLDEAKEVKDLERVELSVTEKSYETTSRESPNPQSDVLLDEVVLSESVDSSTRRLEVFWRTTWRVWSGMPSLTLSMPRGRLLLLWTSSTLWSDKARPSTDSVVKQPITIGVLLLCGSSTNFQPGLFKGHQHLFVSNPILWYQR